MFTDSLAFSRTDIITPVSGASGGDVGHGDSHRSRASASTPSEAKGLSPDLVRRFHALIEEVTGELMRDPDQDHESSRADAIALLIATCEHVESSSEPGESPLQYLLLEEQRKAVAALGNKVGMPDDSFTFLRA
ncbi:MAG TPA: hypothetical protein VIN58_05575 [Roseateles sp.]